MRSIRIKKETDVEIECFIHGAMCTCYSVRCMLSNYMTNRDSNRGGCAQICRFAFDIEDNEKSGILSRFLLVEINFLPTDIIAKPCLIIEDHDVVSG